MTNPLRLPLPAAIIRAEVTGMKEIHIARTIVQKRREKGMTQDELASYMGVSKAAVSKWEIGVSQT